MCTILYETDDFTLKICNKTLPQAPSSTGQTPSPVPSSPSSTSQTPSPVPSSTSSTGQTPSTPSSTGQTPSTPSSTGQTPSTPTPSSTPVQAPVAATPSDAEGPCCKCIGPSPSPYLNVPNMSSNLTSNLTLPNQKKSDLALLHLLWLLLIPIAYFSCRRRRCFHNLKVGFIQRRYINRSKSWPSGSPERHPAYTTRTKSDNTFDSIVI